MNPRSSKPIIQFFGVRCVFVLISALGLSFSPLSLEAGQKKSGKSKKSSISLTSKKKSGKSGKKSKSGKAGKSGKSGKKSKSGNAPSSGGSYAGGSSNGGGSGAPLPQYQVTVTTLAGSETSGSTDGARETAKFNQPTGLATDLNGYIYVADSNNHKIRKISSDGQVSTLAGSGSARLSGFRDGTGASADFYYPSGVAVDLNRNVYVSDYNRIRKITQSGEVALINSSYGMECSGVAVDINGNIFVLNVSESKIYKITSTGFVSIFAGSGSIGSNDGLGTAASFYYPRGVAVDKNGNVYVADSGNMKIRKITPYGGVTTLAGSGLKGSTDGIGADASFTDPMAINVDSSGNVYVGDEFKIRKITPSGQVTTLAGTGINDSSDGTGNTATFSYIQGIALDSLGNVYVSETFNNKIRKITIPR